MPRILRDSLRTFSSSENQPSPLYEPADGTTFSASGAGNGESDCASPAASKASRTSPARTPTPLPTTAASSAYRRSGPATPAPDTAWYDATTSSFS